MASQQKQRVPSCGGSVAGLLLILFLLLPFHMKESNIPVCPKCGVTSRTVSAVPRLVQ
jgi:hypothetical protein